MKSIFGATPTSNIVRIKILDSASTTGAGKTGLLYSTTGLIISTLRINEAAPTVYTQAGGTIEDITTLGTFAAPTATKCRFKEVDSTNHKGVYELQFDDARFTSPILLISISGAAGVAEQDFEIQCVNIPSQVKGIDTDAITNDSVKANAVTKIQAGLALDSTVAKDATVSKPGIAQTITPPADMALNSTVAKDATVAKESTLSSVGGAVVAVGNAMALDSNTAKEATVNAVGSALVSGFSAGAKEATIVAGFLAAAKEATVAALNDFNPDTDAVDGMTYAHIMELTAAMVNGNFSYDTATNRLTFFKRNGTTPLTVVHVPDDNTRERIS